MAAKKNQKYVVELEFKDDRPGYYRQVASVSGKDFGIDFHVEYGAYISAGNMGPEPPRPHTHKYNQVNLFLGCDPNDMGELGAEIEYGIGDKGENYMITTSSVVTIPAGVPHYPAHIHRMNRRFVYMELSIAANTAMKTLPALKKHQEPGTINIAKAEYWQNVAGISFIRKGPWAYGARNRDDSGGHLAFIGNPSQFDYLIMHESIKKAPYRFSPIPDKPHIHPKPEILFFMGTDVNDLTNLGAEAELVMGKELETFVITKPTAVIIPGGLPHCPLTITKIDRPMILTDVRPFGSEPLPIKKA